MTANNSRLDSSCHYLFGLINMKPLITYDTCVLLTDSHDVEHVLALKCDLQCYVLVQLCQINPAAGGSISEVMTQVETTIRINPHTPYYIIM